MQSSLSNLISNYNLLGEINQRSTDFYHELHRFRKGDYFTTKIKRQHIPFENKTMQSARERMLEKWIVEKVSEQNDKIEILFRCIIQPYYLTLPDDRYEIRTDMGWKKMMIRVGKPKKTRRVIDIAGQRQLVDLNTISFCDIFSSIGPTITSGLLTFCNMEILSFLFSTIFNGKKDENAG